MKLQMNIMCRHYKFSALLRENLLKQFPVVQHEDNPGIQVQNKDDIFNLLIKHKISFPNKNIHKIKLEMDQM